MELRNECNSQHLLILFPMFSAFADGILLQAMGMLFPWLSGQFGMFSVITNHVPPVCGPDGGE